MEKSLKHPRKSKEKKLENHQNILEKSPPNLSTPSAPPGSPGLGRIAAVAGVHAARLRAALEDSGSLLGVPMSKALGTKKQKMSSFWLFLSEVLIKIYITVMRCNEFLVVFWKVLRKEMSVVKGFFLHKAWEGSLLASSLVSALPDLYSAVPQMLWLQLRCWQPLPLQISLQVCIGFQNLSKSRIFQAYAQNKMTMDPFSVFEPPAKRELPISSSLLCNEPSFALA